MSHSLFVYGTLRDPVLLEGLIGRRPNARAASLRGWRCEFVRSRPYPGIAPDAEGCVAGDILLALAEDELAALDRYEGELYERLEVEVEVDVEFEVEGGVDIEGGARERVFVYALREAHRGLLDGRPWAPPAHEP